MDNLTGLAVEKGYGDSQGSLTQISDLIVHCMAAHCSVIRQILMEQRFICHNPTRGADRPESLGTYRSRSSRPTTVVNNFDLRIYRVEK